MDAPTIRQLYDPPRINNGVLTPSGNPDLAFERAHHIEVGIKNQWQQAALNIALYQARVRDFIEREEGAFINKDLLVFRGMDISAIYTPTSNLVLRTDLGLLDAKDRSANTSSTVLQYRPEYKLTLDADYRMTSRWVFNTRYQHIGRQAYFSRADASEYQYLSSYGVVSTRLSYLMPGDMGSYYLGVDNLLDKDFVTSYGFPQQGRFIYTGLTLNW